MRFTALYDITPWNNFHSPLVKDLAWMLFACDLINHQPLNKKTPPFKLFKPRDYKKANDWLTRLDASHLAGETPILQRESFKRLGLYCEALFEVITTHGYNAGITPYKLLKRNIQINKKSTKITLGELDFLVQSENGITYHVEMAIKFYLMNNQKSQDTALECKAIPPNTYKCIGPNRADRLDLKLHRLLTHQLPLINQPETQQRLNKEKIHTVQTPSSLYLKGQIYSYYLNKLKPINTALYHPHLAWSHINRALHAMTLYEKKYKKKSTTCRWIILEKLDWLTSPTIKASDINKTYTKEKLANEFIDKHEIKFKPPILIELIIFKEHSCTHATRIMLVKNNWPTLLSR